MVVFGIGLHSNPIAHQGLDLFTVPHHLHLRVGTKGILGCVGRSHYFECLGIDLGLYLLHPAASDMGLVDYSHLLSKPGQLVG